MIIALLVIFFLIPAFGQSEGNETEIENLKIEVDRIASEVGSNLAIQVVLALATIFLVIFTISNLRESRKLTKSQTETMIQQMKQTERQLKLAESEFEHKIKADIKISEIRSHFRIPNPGSKEKVKLRIYITLKNFGNVDAYKVRPYFKIFDQLPTITEVIRIEDEIKTEKIEIDGSLIPDHIFNDTIVKIFEKLESKYFVLWLEYNYEDVEDETLVYRYKLLTGREAQLLDIHTNDDLDLVASQISERNQESKESELKEN